MNKLILNTGVQEFISKNLNTDIVSVLLKKPLFEGVAQKELAQQLESKKKCKDKLPNWFGTTNIYFPNKLHIEQTSSELTAQYKSGLVHGEKLLDLTGGLGVDSYYFAANFETVFHCEINPTLSEIAQHNFQVLGRTNIKCVAQDGFHFLDSTEENFDWIFVDPSRRNDVKGKVFLLKDCLPNLTEHLPTLFLKTSNILVKASPLLDLKQGILELDFVKEIHVVAIRNEVKELLYVLERDYQSEIEIKTVNLVQGASIRSFNFPFSAEQTTKVDLGAPQTYLYEPNAAILKSGGFKSVGASFGVIKLHPHSHLYTSTTLMDFPGRRFKIHSALPYSKSSMKDLSITKANLTTRNFPLTVSELRKKHKIKDGGNRYLFFTKTENDQLMVLDCTKES